MPFTLAHAAAGIPLRRLPLVWSAFFIGCFAPDFEYFLWLSPQNSLGHHFPGILTFTLPVALVTLWAFHQFVREPLTRLLPVRLQQKLMASVESFRWGGAKRIAAILGSVALGITSHVFWDAFTHVDTWATDLWPVLVTPVNLPLFGMRPLVTLLQLASSVLGMAALVLWARGWYQRTEPAPELPQRHLSRKDKLVLACAMLVLASAGAVVRAIQVIGMPDTQHDVHYFVVVLAVTSIALMWWQLLALGVFWKTADRVKASTL
jgi:hypothetical protein